jgi:hypothetical protein
VSTERARVSSWPFGQCAETFRKVLWRRVSNGDLRPERVGACGQQAEPDERRTVECVASVQKIVFLQRAAAQRKPSPQETSQAEMNFLGNELTRSLEHGFHLILGQVRFEYAGVCDSVMAPLGYRVFLCPGRPSEDASSRKADVTLENPRNVVLGTLKDESMDPARGFTIGRERCLCLRDQSRQRKPDCKESDAAGSGVCLPEFQQRQIDRRRIGPIGRLLECVLTVHSSENAN